MMGIEKEPVGGGCEVYSEGEAAGGVLGGSASIGVVDLGPEMCKWPVGIPGEADFTFCGRRTSRGASYCGKHAKQAYHVVYARKVKRRAFVDSPNVVVGAVSASAPEPSIG